MLEKRQRVLITGGAGFIGSAFVHRLAPLHDLVVLDKLTYAGHVDNISGFLPMKSFSFIEGAIEDEDTVQRIFQEFKPSWVVNIAAESHVDRSISGPRAFVETNIVGVYVLLDQALKYFRNLEGDSRKSFRFLQMSTDEVFGQLGVNGKFSELSNYAPSSPYSASKAAAEMLVRAWNHTYGLPTIITNCSNNYGPRQTPEKLIPVTIQSCLEEKPIPIYGRGENVRDWIHVDDHCRGVVEALELGRPGEVYCFGGGCELTNIDLVALICATMDKKWPRKSGGRYFELVQYVTDRLGHDFRYAIDFSKAATELGFANRKKIEDGISETIEWYLNNQNWVRMAKGKL